MNQKQAKKLKKLLALISPEGTEEYKAGWNELKRVYNKTPSTERGSFARDFEKTVNIVIESKQKEI